MGDYKDLRVWDSAIEFASDLYAATRSIPADERFGLTSQLRRAAVSISANIAEGSTKGQSLRSNKEFARFIAIAQGSAAEVESLLIISSRLEFIEKTRADGLITDLVAIRKMLSSLLSTINHQP